MTTALQLNVDSPHSYTEHRAWLASIALSYVARNDKTVLSDMQFEGPLRVQRSFYPENERNHTYLLHPPGGMVSGDQIQISATLAEGAKVLVTTPSAGKVYGADTLNLPQRQAVSLKVRPGAELEWLPQENIVFDGANAFLDMDIEISGSSRLIAWDLVSFGRPHGGFLFQKGALEQTLSIKIDGKPVLLEAFKTDPDLEILSSPIGLMGHLHMGNMVVLVPEKVDCYKDWVDEIRTVLPSPSPSLKLAITAKKQAVIVRGLADDIETLRNHFINIWERLRPLALDVDATQPRIWST